MEVTETFQSAITAILANRMRSFLTILGIVIGTTSIILLISLTTGLQSYITSQIQGLGSNLIFVAPGRIGGARTPGGVQANRLTLRDSNNLKSSLLGQAQVSAVIQRTVTVNLGNKSDKNVAIFGVESNYPKLITSLETKQGRFFETSEEAAGKMVAVIGPTVAKELFDSGNPVNRTINVAGLKYIVIGVTSARGSAFGQDQDNVVYAPLPAVERQFGLDRLNTIYISANTPEEVKVIQEKATSTLKKRLSEDEFSILTQEQTLSTISQITGVLTLALGGITAISLLVGGIGVMNIMLVAVTERTREIGLRKALGAKPRDIRNQFLIEAITLSGLGGIIGIIFGFVFSLIVGRFITTIVPLWSVALSFGFAMLVGVVFGVAPAIRASKLDPIQALRYE